jgi:hypothetical protein
VELHGISAIGAGGQGCPPHKIEEFIFWSSLIASLQIIIEKFYVTKLNLALNAFIFTGANRLAERDCICKCLQNLKNEKEN